jgi:enoyl-CoA hydratase
MSLQVTIDGNVCVAVIAREHRLNAVDDNILEGLLAVVGRVNAREVTAVVLTGSGTKSFSSGSDIKELADQSPEQRLAHTALGNRLLNEIEESPGLFVAAVEGYCLGGGLELALACDLRIAGRGSIFGLPEVRISALPTWGGTYRLGRTVGAGRAKEVVLFNRRLSSDEALAWGLVSEVVDTGKACERAVDAVAAAVASTDRLTLATAKSLMHHSYGLSARTAGHLEYLADLRQSASAEQSESFVRFAGEAG